ncbi:MAG: M14 family metallopeptidase [Candidatus Aminicenantales bacterium]
MRKNYIFLLIFFIVFHLSFSDARGKDKKISVLGKYDFYHYYTYEELTSYLKDLHNAHPQLTELKPLCTSEMGRNVWMLIINNPETGKAEDKPGFFLNQIHASEVIASMSCCYTAWFLLENYGKRKDVTQIVDNIVWYIVPRLDVDGAEAYLTRRPAGKDPDPVDDDGDFAFDEDPAEDIDGDGYIVQMRKKDPKGEWKISEEDPRMMRRKAPDESGGTYYKIYTEGIDNDGDGKINEDGFRTRFLSNRNYPGNWKPQIIQRGGGRYPMEEKITRAEVDFVAAHPNIALYLQHHCCGRVILRPPATYPDKEFKYKDDLELYRVVSARCLEHSGWDLATSVYDWNWPRGTPNRKSTQIYRDKEGRIKNAPRGMYPEESETESEYDFSGWRDEYQRDRGYFAWGSSIETMYDLFGIFSMGDEHWNIPDYNKDGKITEKERLRWNDEEREGKMYIDWHPFNHPTLGEVEIGGWRRWKVSPPEGKLIQKECEMGNNFVIYLAGLAPKIRIGETKITDKKGGIYQVDITVENTGLLPTATELAQNLKVVKPVILEVEPDDNLEILSGERKVKLGHIKGNSESRKTTYIVRVKDDSKKAVLKVMAKSQKAGKDSKEIIIQ